MNLESLLEQPELNIRASLFIEPLAPLSLVTSMPGAYYRSQREPSDFMIYGMLENALGWQFDTSERVQIIRDLKKYHKKSMLSFSDKSPVGYQPLLQHHVKIEKVRLIPHIESYDDYWIQHLKDVDERHPKGNRNYDFLIEKYANKIYSQPKEERDKSWRSLYEKKSGLFPNYYQKPTIREFIVVYGEYRYSISTTKSLLVQLQDSLAVIESPLYLGTSEGWVNLIIEQL